MKILIFLMLFVVPILAMSKPIFEFEDIRGDDHAWGDVNYPIGGAVSNGDLDILSIEAEINDESLVFTAVFRNKIDTPEGVYGDTGQPISSYVREKFYKQNIDIYINTGLATAENITGLMPGRNVRTSKDIGWNYAVILTPRPQAIGDVLVGELVHKLKKRLAADGVRVPDESELEADIRHSILPRFFFPQNSKVLGRSIRFSVPLDFFSEHPSPEWKYLIVVSAADVEGRGTLPLLAKDEQPIFTRPIVGGGNSSTFGGNFRAHRYTPQVIDVVIPREGVQEQLLAAADENVRQYAVLPMLSPNRYPDFDMPELTSEFRGSEYGDNPWTGIKRDSVKQLSGPNSSESESQTKEPEPLPVVKGNNAISEKSTLSEKALNPYDAESSKKENFNPLNRPPLERLRELDALKEKGMLNDKEYDELRRRIIMSI